MNKAVMCAENLGGDHNKSGKKLINSVCILTLEPTGYPERLGVGLGKNRGMKDYSMGFVFVLGLLIFYLFLLGFLVLFWVFVCLLFLSDQLERRSFHLLK